MDAYNKDPIAYMQGVKKALAQFRMNQEEMYETVESATKVVGMNGDDAVNNFMTIYGSRWYDISNSLKDSIDAHDAIAAKPIPINEKELQKITFSPSDKTSDETIQKALTTYRSTPEYKAQKQGFDPTGGFQRFSTGELMFQQPYPSLIQGTTLTHAAYYKAKAAGDTGEDILGKELNEAIQQQEIPSSEEIVKQKKALGVGKKQTDEELSAPTNLPLGVMPLPSYTRKQASFVDKVLKEKGVKEKVKFMLDPFGSRNWTFKQLKKGVNTKRYEIVEVKSDNVESTMRFDGLESICVQHEIDHLNGKTIFDRKIEIGSYKRDTKKIGRNELVTIKKGDAVKVLKYKKVQKMLNDGWEII